MLYQVEVIEGIFLMYDILQRKQQHRNVQEAQVGKVSICKHNNIYFKGSRYFSTHADRRPTGPETAKPPSLKYSKQACLKSFI